MNKVLLSLVLPLSLSSAYAGSCFQKPYGVVRISNLHDARECFSLIPDLLHRLTRVTDALKRSLK